MIFLIFLEVDKVLRNLDYVEGLDNVLKLYPVKIGSIQPKTLYCSGKGEKVLFLNILK